MGQYLQLGIVHHILIEKDKANEAGLSVNNLRDKLNEEMDMSLFDCHVNDNEISFVIKEAVVLEQLHGFMKL